MIVVLCLHVVLGTVAVAFGRRLGRRAAWICLPAPLAGAAVVLARLGEVLDGGAPTEVVTWVDRAGLDLALRLDGFAALFALLVTGVGVVVLVYAAAYLPAAGDDGVGRLLGLLTLFAGAMLGLVLADDLLALYGFWELTSVTSYLLIGNDHQNPKARAAALQALLITSAGALAMLVGFVLLGQEAGTFRISELLADPPTGTVVTVAVALVALGAVTKSAQYPFHAWLPGAMTAATPVSAYLHSATMVTAGVFLVARLGPAFGDVGSWRPALVTIGLVTMLGGGLRALRQQDLKLLLAHGTVSQLGFMMVLFGLGGDDARAAGVELVLAHGLFKAALFLVVGILDHQTGTRDRRRLPALGAGWLPVKVVAVANAASMAGIPLLFGFVAKEEALTALEEGGGALDRLALVGVVLGSILTVAYSARFLGPLLRRPATSPDDERAPAVSPAPSPAPPGALLLGPALALTTVTVVLGVVPGLGDAVLDAAVQALQPGSEPVHLALWHGLNVPLGLSALIVAVGLVVHRFRERLDGLLAAGSRLPSGGDVYVGVLRGTNALADRVTAVVQSGSLPIYAGVILATTAVLTGGALLAGGFRPPWPDVVDRAAHVPVAAAVVIGAVAAAATRRRFAAALFLGVTGYAMAALFVVSGAPDLALTQVAIETLTTVLFVLVLRRLPGDFTQRAPIFRRALRALVATSVAVTVFAFGIIAAGSRRAEPISEEMVQRAVPDGNGKNVVNVILVDFRALDTMGEVTVLAAAAIGAVALARAGRRPRVASP